MMLYHRVPIDLRGDSLMPLNVLKQRDRELYEKCNEKYDGREVIKDIKVPYLDCLWNDVIFLSPVHPEKIVSAMREAGIEVYRKIKWFEICPQKNGITAENTVIYDYTSPFPLRAEMREFEPFNPRRLEKVCDIKSEVVEYYQFCRVEGTRPQMFHLVPHVLYQGILRLDNLVVIEA